MEQGIIVGSDQSQEWLLSWWWENYRRQNSYPVAFFDFGLSEEKKRWCREKGKLIRTPFVWVKEKEEIDSHLAEEWEHRYGENFWTARSGWFKKPLACLHSPFQKSLWLDLDCEIVAPLNPLFSLGNIALAKDQILPQTYNSGVILFAQNHPLIHQWAKQAEAKSGQYRNDQDLLSQIIKEERLPICELAPIYNWNVGFGLNSEVVIYHWLGEAAKNALRNQLIFNEL